MKKKLPTLTKGQRGHIYDTMTDDQIKVLSEFCMYELKSRFHTNRFLAETDWEFEGIQIDPWYNRSKEHQGMNYHCECGRRVKNLFILRSKDRHNGQYLIKRLGITHFEQEAGIPKIVTNEILNQMNEINIYRDQILLDYKEHQKFPNQLFKTAVGLGVFENHQYTTLYKKCESFQRAGLPLFINDKRRLKRAVKHSPKNTFWYKGKYQATFTDKISAEKCYVSLTKYLINYNPIISHVSLKKLN